MRDAEACLTLAPRFAKAHFAKGRALYFMADYEAAFVQYDAGLSLEHHPRIEAWLEAERHKPEYATRAGPRALVGRLAAAVRANDVRRLALVLGRCPAQVLTAPSSHRRWAGAPHRCPHSMLTKCRAYCACYPPYDPPYTLLRLLNVRTILTFTHHTYQVLESSLQVEGGGLQLPLLHMAAAAGKAGHLHATPCHTLLPCYSPLAR